ncbi:putative fad dependent oxidoreductase protein [Rosellinia necatrix]|uniref:Putative fad dependent oxidoreductase protein n=1 Tax=Rosellinia necatrix TaxID=77044 RepID=A0A1W2TES1_ROSNE|nr:putative fad dependent oxidoreductase protein [Rosellinia necatrix]
MNPVDSFQGTEAGQTPIKNVAVIGAGISGVVSAAHLLKEGFRVTVFERTGTIGGVWYYDERVDLDPPFPNTVPEVQDWTDLETEGLTVAEALRLHGPPGPCYAGLKNNVPTTLMKSSLLPWPAGTEEFIDQGRIVQYLEDIAKLCNVVGNVQFHTRVESVLKPEGDTQWKVKTSTVHVEGDTFSKTRRSEGFDAVVVASGHYHVPFVPDIPGLSDWKGRFPGRVIHSKSYRTPAPFKGKTVLLIGAGASSLDIAREVDALGGKVYQSRRESKYDLTASRLPQAIKRVAMVGEFIINEEAASEPQCNGNSGGMIPGRAVLEDGTTLENIDYVVVATGYITSYPFLEGLQQPLVAWEDAGERTLITADGYTTHNLHKDIFYIPDPTLVFVGVSQLVSTFSLFDFQAKVMAKVLAGRARLPAESVMKVEQRERKARLQPGDRFHALLLGEQAYIAEVLAWVNGDLAEAGLAPMEGMDAEWVMAYDDFRDLGRR